MTEYGSRKHGLGLESESRQVFMPALLAPIAARPGRSRRWPGRFARHQGHADVVNGGEPQAVGIGQTVNGVKLIAIQGDQAIVEVDGRKRPLKVGQHAVGSGGGDGGARWCWDRRRSGHFYTTGSSTAPRFACSSIPGRP